MHPYGGSTSKQYSLSAYIPKGLNQPTFENIGGGGHGTTHHMGLVRDTYGHSKNTISPVTKLRFDPNNTGWTNLQQGEQNQFALLRPPWYYTWAQREFGQYPRINATGNKYIKFSGNRSGPFNYAGV